MDHEIKPSVKKLAASLMDQTPSDWSEALSELDALCALTTLTLDTEKNALIEDVPNATDILDSSAPSPKTQRTAPEAPVPERVSVPEKYAGAPLKDQKVLDALLNFHKMHAPVVGATTGPKPAKNSERSVFSPMEIPILEATPKSRHAQQPGSSGFSSAILKPRKPPHP